MPVTDYEKLGAFYLGRPYDLASGTRAPEPLLYDSRDLVTHALCVGMTGSGKTGLCVGLLEEAAIDGVPAIVIDPKGDLANLLLTFPELRPEDFEPWVNPDDAARKNLSVPDYAQQQAELWRKGLADWDQGPDRIARLRSSADFTVYTPGSSAGVPVSILRGFAAPPPRVMEDAELLGEQIETAVSGLLGLVGIQADPMQSREHILLSAILRENWQKGQDVDLAGLIGQVQQPPVKRVGVMEVDLFYPAKERFELAMRLNNLLAAPGFETWLAGEPLDVGGLLRTAEGKPRVSIFSIAHLSEAERMFFVTLLLNQVLGWTRSQSGTTSLRAIVYMDEIFGYFPPVANPPSKRPLLAMLKQARAFGVGVVLATQNPVDLDYKGLANCGTWFIGRLQTERDKQRLLEGLEGAAVGAKGFDRSAMEQTLAGLGSRVFLMNNVHDDGPVIFQTRWALSYLRGPLTRDQIRRLAPKPAEERATVARAQQAAPPSRGKKAAVPPPLPPEIPQIFLPSPAGPAGATLEYAPAVLGIADIHFEDGRRDVSLTQRRAILAPVGDGAVTIDWGEGEPAPVDEASLLKEPASDAVFLELPQGLATSFEKARKNFPKAIGRLATLELFKSKTLNLVSRPGEDERSFRARLAQAAAEGRDETTHKLRRKYRARFDRLEGRLARAKEKIETQSEQASSARWNTAVSAGAAVLGAILGRRRLGVGSVGRAATTARGAGRMRKEQQDVERARREAAEVEQELRELEAAFRKELNTAHTKLHAATQELERITIRPRRSDTTVRLVALAWVPRWMA